MKWDEENKTGKIIVKYSDDDTYREYIRIIALFSLTHYIYEMSIWLVFFWILSECIIIVVAVDVWCYRNKTEFCFFSIAKETKSSSLY